MATDKQKQTARENGKKSHGPTSAGGKAVSSQNAVTYGFRSTRWLVRNDEDRAQLVALPDAFTAEYQPSGPTETALVRDLAHSRYSLERIWAMQMAGLDFQIDQQRPRLERHFDHLDEPTCLYLAFNTLANNGPGFALTQPLPGLLRARLPPRPQSPPRNPGRSPRAGSRKQS